MANMDEAGYPPEVRERYLHMAVYDSVVWSAFLREYGDTIRRVWYDVHVGTVPCPPGADPIADKQHLEGVYCKRIDAVCSVGREFWVCEVKPFANHVSLGQALLYADLWEQRYPSLKPYRPVVVAATADVDAAESMRVRGVSLFLLKAAAFTTV